jgi:hypothetical protein
MECTLLLPVQLPMNGARTDRRWGAKEGVTERPIPIWELEYASRKYSRGSDSVIALAAFLENSLKRKCGFP